MSYSIDTNILVYASDADGPLHRPAAAFLDRCMSGPEILYLAWPVAMSYLRIATHPSIFNAPLSPEEARGNMEALISLPHVRFLSEGADFWHKFSEVCAEAPVRGNLVPDAHLAALLREHGVRRLYTRDRDFRRFDFLQLEDPLA